ncbi:MAG: DUF86 domain-containing protein [Candidatus Thermoplasmatota archaeon]
MIRDIRLYLQDILESIQAIEEYTNHLTSDEFCSNRQVQDAVIRRIEIIGEAVKNIQDDIRNKYSDIPWKKIAGMRDVFIHEYFGVKLQRLWEVVKRDLPDLKQKIILIMKEIK